MDAPLDISVSGGSCSVTMISGILRRKLGMVDDAPLAKSAPGFSVSVGADSGILRRLAMVGGV